RWPGHDPHPLDYPMRDRRIQPRTGRSDPPRPADNLRWRVVHPVPSSQPPANRWIWPPIRPMLASLGRWRSSPSGGPPGTAPGAKRAIQREDANLVEAGVGFELGRSGARGDRESDDCRADRGELRSWGMDGLRGLVGAPAGGPRSVKLLTRQSRNQ